LKGRGGALKGAHLLATCFETDSPPRSGTTRRLLRSIISPSTSSRFIVHYAARLQWPLPSVIGFEVSMILWPRGNPTNTGGGKERRNKEDYYGVGNLLPGKGRKGMGSNFD
jgi:hypothetical protein